MRPAIFVANFMHLSNLKIDGMPTLKIKILLLSMIDYMHYI